MSEAARIWVRYHGPRGGDGWRNLVSGEVRYVEEQPFSEPVDGDAYFSSKSLESAKNAEYKSREIVVYLAPEEFLKLAEKSLASADKTATVEGVLGQGEKFSSVPSLGFEHDGKGNAVVVSHEGRHRSRSLAKRGVKLIPVVLRSIGGGGGAAIRWDQQSEGNFDLLKGEWPKRLVSQDGDYVAKFPVADLRVESKVETVQSPQTPVSEWAKNRFGDMVAENGGLRADNFVRWFKNSKVVDENGYPLTMYHGSRAVFDEFATDPPEDKSGWAMFDRAVGAHFASDPSVASAFTTGEYAASADYWYDEYSPERSWLRVNGEVVGGVPLLSFVSDGDSENGFQRTYEPYNPEIHREMVKEKKGYLRPVLPGGVSYPVYLSIQNPLVIELGPKQTDQYEIPRKVAEIVFPEDRDLFAMAYSKSRATSVEDARKIWDDLKAGIASSSDVDGRLESFAYIARNYSPMMSDMDVVRRSKAILKRLGYDGIKYTNTSRNEIKGDADPWCWIAFDKEQIKSAIGNNGNFSSEAGSMKMKAGMKTRWVRYVGPRKGRGWRNSSTGEVRYVKQPPNDDSGNDRDGVEYQITLENGKRLPRLKHRKNVTPEEFVKAREESAAKGNKRVGYLSPSSAESLKDHELFLTEDGLVGVAIGPDGDAQNVFNNSSVKYSGVAMLLDAIEQSKIGVRTADCYDGFLPSLYSQFGFTEVGRMKFAKEHAPQGWNFERDGSPDVVFIARTKKMDRETIFRNVARASSLYEHEKSSKYYEDWDEAKSDSRRAFSAAITRRKAADVQGNRRSVDDGRDRATGDGRKPADGRGDRIPGRLATAKGDAKKVARSMSIVEKPRRALFITERMSCR